MGVPVGVPREPRARARAAGATTSSTASSPGSRRSRTSRSATPTRSRSRPSRRPTGSATRPARSQREKLLGRLDALLALSDRSRDAAAERFPGDYRARLAGHRPGALPAGDEAAADRRRAAAERARRRPRRPPGAARASGLGGRAAADEAARRDGRRSRATSPTRVHVRTARDGASRAALLNEAAIFVPGLDGLARVLLEAQAAGCAIASPRGVEEQPELAGAAVARLAEDDALRAAEQERARRAAAGAIVRTTSRPSSSELYATLDQAPTRPAPRTPTRSPTGLDRRRPAHAHRVVVRLRDRPGRAPRPRRGGRARRDRDHRPQRLRRRARDRSTSPATATSIVIPGEEVKTDDQGEVIGLFLEREIPRGMSFADTIAAIREQGGLVYVPHPFDRMHTVPDAGDAAPPPRRHRRLRGLQRAAAVRGPQRRGAALRAQVRPDDGRRLRRARAPGRRHRRAAHARVRRPRGVPDLARRAPRSCGGRSRSPTSRA